MKLVTIEPRLHGSRAKCLGVLIASLSNAGRSPLLIKLLSALLTAAFILGKIDT